MEEYKIDKLTYNTKAINALYEEEKIYFNEDNEIIESLKYKKIIINDDLPIQVKGVRSIDLINTEGELIRRRFYDSNGLAIKDIDFHNHGNSKIHSRIPHEHYWTWVNGKAKRN